MSTRWGRTETAAMLAGLWTSCPQVCGRDLKLQQRLERRQTWVRVGVGNLGVSVCSFFQTANTLAGLRPQRGQTLAHLEAPVTLTAVVSLILTEGPTVFHKHGCWRRSGSPQSSASPQRGLRASRGHSHLLLWILIL